MIGRLVRRIAAALAIVGLSVSPLRAATDCLMPEETSRSVIATSGESHAGREAHQGHEARERASQDDRGTTPSHDRCPDFAGCSSPVGPIASLAELDVSTSRAVGPIPPPAARAAGPVATLDPPPPRR